MTPSFNLVYAMVTVRKIVKYTSLSPFIFVIVLSANPGGNFDEQLNGAPLEGPFRLLVEGRKVGILNDPQTATRKDRKDDFLGWIGVGEFEEGPAQELCDAWQSALDFKLGDSVSNDESKQAEYMIQESLEALFDGYLFAGNDDLLNALRTSYPNFSGSTATDSDPRQTLPAEWINHPIEYFETSQTEGNRAVSARAVQLKRLSYAKHYFFFPVTEALSFLSANSGGSLRGLGEGEYALSQFTAFNDPTKLSLPYVDPYACNENFPYDNDNATSQRRPSLTAGYMYGSALERWALATQTLADQLWKVAYFGDQGDAGRPSRSEILGTAVDELATNAHAQFLASLPLAATMDDADLGGYRVSQMDRTKVSATDAILLMRRIRDGEVPKLDLEVTSWSPGAIRSQVDRVRQVYDDVLETWGGSGTPTAGSLKELMSDSRAAKVMRFSDEQNLKTGILANFNAVTGIKLENFDLSNEVGRDSLESQLVAIENTIISPDFNTGSPIVEFENGASLNLEGTSLLTSGIHLRQAYGELLALERRINSFAELIKVELQARDELDAIIEIGSRRIAAMDMISTVLGSVSVGFTFGTPGGATVSANPFADHLGQIAYNRTIASGSQQIRAGNVETRAAIERLLIEQRNVSAQMDPLFENTRLFVNEIRAQLADARRSVENYRSFSKGREDLWYADPDLAGRMEVVEETYQTEVQRLRVELYKLARMLEWAWLERFSNPIARPGGGTPYALEEDYDEFVIPESVFLAPNHERAVEFFDALVDWDSKMRTVVLGASEVSINEVLPRDAHRFAGFGISLRRDILGLIDYERNQDGRYIINQAARRDSLRRFQSYILDHLDNPDAVNPSLTIEFPFTYGLNKENVTGTNDYGPIVRDRLDEETGDEFWNHRIDSVYLVAKGDNVFSGTGTNIEADWKLFGEVEVRGFRQNSAFNVNSRNTKELILPTYISDRDNNFEIKTVFYPDEPTFGTNDPVPGKVSDGTFVPLYCGNVIVRIKQSNDFIPENLEDIEFFINMKVGPPEEIFLSPTYNKL